ncbi:unnamed protein product [Closterium sp. NIES-65]|nr:unnamed protein product [Closterium sp. NIES-65]
MDVSSKGIKGTLPTVLGNLTSLDELQECWLPQLPFSPCPPPPPLSLREPHMDVRAPKTNRCLASDRTAHGSLASTPHPMGRRRSVSLGIAMIVLSPPLCPGCSILVKQLFKNYLNGTIPPSMGNMRSLYQLHLNLNYLAGGIPDSFSQLTGMRKFYVSSNLLSGPFPPVLCNMTTLWELRISYNHFSGTVPECISNLKNAYYLLAPIVHTVQGLCSRVPFSLALVPSPSSNLLSPPACSSPCVLLPLRAPPPACSSPCVLLPLRAPPPACSSPCVRLPSLPLSPRTPGLSSLPHAHPPASSPLPALRSYIDTNWFTGTLPSTIGNLPLLQNLFINQNSLQGPLPATITSLTSLRILFMSSNPYLDGPLPSDLGNMVSLTDFVMEFAAFNGTMPDSITKLTRLSRMSVTPPSCPAKPPTCPLSLASPACHLMDNCRFTGSIPQGLSNLKALTVLDLEGGDSRGSCSSTASLLRCLVLPLS